jgi:large subunit ribosomal protein L22e
MTTKVNKGNREKKINLKFTIDCSKPVEDKVFSTTAFADFLKQRIKVNNKPGKLGSDITVSSDGKGVTVTASINLSKRYLKYLTKKYLKKHSLREFLYVVANSKTSYQIRYFNIQQEEDQ